MKRRRASPSIHASRPRTQRLDRTCDERQYMGVESSEVRGRGSELVEVGTGRDGIGRVRAG